MHRFTYDFLKDKTITSELFSLSNIITDLKVKTEIKKVSNRSLFASLETIAIKESVSGSNAIEGIFTTEKRIREIIEEDSKPLTHSEEEIAGYHDAIKFITENYKDLSFDETIVKMIHAMLQAANPVLNLLQLVLSFLKIVIWPHTFDILLQCSCKSTGLLFPIEQRVPLIIEAAQLLRCASRSHFCHRHIIPSDSFCSVYKALFFHFIVLSPNSA